MKIALLIIYNHRFDQNISVLNSLYKDKFSHIYHVVPFYDGKDENVIPVFENSYYFQNYIVQAYQKIRDLGFSHYFIIADDLILNPVINENSLFEKIGLGFSDNYISGMDTLYQSKWNRSVDAACYNVNLLSVEASPYLPSESEAIVQYNKHGIESRKESFIKVLLRNYKFLHTKIPHLIKRFHTQISKRKFIPYPLVGGYSDILLINNDTMPSFCYYSGIFAATDLFVELAIPSALCLSTDAIKTNETVLLKKGDLWTKQDLNLLEKYNYNLNDLLDNYPTDLLYIHPIKLSKWAYNIKP